MRNTIYATFSDPKMAEKAAGALLDHGLSPADLTIIQSHKWKNAPQVSEQESDEEPNLQQHAETGITTTTREDAISGASSGVQWGIGIGTVAAVASLFIPGFGLVLGGGGLAVALAGLVGSTGAGAAVGALTGYLKDQGVESHIVAGYESVVSSGGAVLGATLPSGGVEEDLAWEVLNKYAGQNVISYVNRPYVS